MLLLFYHVCPAGASVPGGGHRREKGYGRRAAPEILRDADLEHYPYRVTEDMLVRAAEKLAS